MSTALDQDAVRALRTVVRPDGTEVHFDAIISAAQGNDLLDELDASIAVLETQLHDHDTGIEVRSKTWRREAAFAHRDKCRMRPRLQKHTGDLRKVERRAADEMKRLAAGDLPGGPANSPKDGQRRAFVIAAEGMLDRDLIVEIWSRARELRPAAFVEGAQS